MIGKIFEIEQELYQFKKDAGMYSRKKIPKQIRSTTNYSEPIKTSEIPYETESIQESVHQEISSHEPFSDSTFAEVYKQEVYAESYTENLYTEPHLESHISSEENSQETQMSDAFAWDDEDTSSQEGGYAVPFAYEIDAEEEAGSSTTSEELSESHSTVLEVPSQKDVEEIEISEAFGWDTETIEGDKDVKEPSFGKAYEIEETHIVPEKQPSKDTSNSFSSKSHPDSGESLSFSVKEVVLDQKEDVIDHTSTEMSLKENTANVEDNSQISISEAFAWDAETIEGDKKDVKEPSYVKSYEIEETHTVLEKQPSKDTSNSFSSTSHPDSGESLSFSIKEISDQKQDVVDSTTSTGMSLKENTANVEGKGQTPTSEAFAWEDLESQTSPTKDKDDFAKDFNAILSGQKQYTPDAQKKPKPAEEKSNSNSRYKAFDKMAAVQQYTNTFDLGTIEVQKKMDALDIVLAHELSKKGNIPLKKDVLKNR